MCNSIGERCHKSEGVLIGTLQPGVLSKLLAAILVIDKKTMSIEVVESSEVTDIQSCIT